MAGRRPPGSFTPTQAPGPRPHELCGFAHALVVGENGAEILANGQSRGEMNPVVCEPVLARRYQTFR